MIDAIKMVASQMGIPPIVVDELKASRPRMVNAQFRLGMVSLEVEVTSPAGTFPVIITLPIEQLQRFPFIYNQALELGKATR
jgi:hypothetical protein